MRNLVLSLSGLCCLLMAGGCGTATAQRSVTTMTPQLPPAAVAATPTEALAPNSSWRKLWTLPVLPPPPDSAYGADPPYTPQIAWSPANAQRLYLCRATINYQNMPAVLHDLYRSDDQGLHWTPYTLPEAASSCRLEVDPTNADALVLLDAMYHTYVSRDGGEHWQAVPKPPHWNTSLVAPVVQIMAGRLYVEGYWTDDLIHWTRWYPVEDEQHVSVQINPQRPQTLYTTVDPKEFVCAGTPSNLHQLGADPIAHQALLCRSDNGGQTWRFLVVVVVVDFSTTLGYWSTATEPLFCLALNHPETLYALGHTAQSYPDPYPGDITGYSMQSTDEGNTWTRMSGVFSGQNSSPPTFDPCGASAYGGQSPVRVDGDYPVENEPWQNFGMAADGAFYHAVDTTGTRQGVTMRKGVSLLTASGWKVIAPYTEGVTTPTTNYRLKLLLLTPPSGASVLLAFTDQAVYSYASPKI